MCWIHHFSKIIILSVYHIRIIVIENIHMILLFTVRYISKHLKHLKLQCFFNAKQRQNLSLLKFINKYDVRSIVVKYLI